MKLHYPNYSIPQVTDDDRRAVSAVLAGNWLAGNGNIVVEFEKALEDYTGYRYAIAVNSATSGLFVAYTVSFAKSFLSTVTIPALTFVATANMALAIEKEVELFDVDSFTLTGDKHFDVGVSYAGYPVEKCVVADDAHYLYPGMAHWKEHDISVVSFHALKHITSGEGGAILTNNYELYLEMSALVDQGRVDRNGGFGFGYNFRMPEISAALAYSQLQRHEAILSNKRDLAMRYYHNLANCSLLSLPPNHERHAWHLFVIRVFNIYNIRDMLADGLRERGIETGRHYPPLHTYEHLRNKYTRGSYPVAEATWETGLSLPLYPAMTLDDVDYISEQVLDILDNIGKLYGL